MEARTIGLANKALADGETGKWYTNALKAAGKGVVKVGVDVVAATIVQAVKGYMG